MPEGPSIVIAKDEMRPLVGGVVRHADGTAKNLEFDRLQGTTLKSVRSWGKHLLLKFDNFTIRVHFLMFGRYAVNEQMPNRVPKLSINFKNGSSLYLYACAITTIEGALTSIYDWSADVMNNRWNSQSALKKLKSRGDVYICDALLDQTVFAGVGNIIKNEVLFRAHVQPLSRVKKIPPKTLSAIVDDTRTYSFLFLKWKRAMQLKKHWEVYTKKKCPRDKHTILKAYTGTTKRRSFYCKFCQKLYA